MPIKIAGLIFFFLLGHFCYGQITSTFDTDEDGWTFTSPVTHHATDGNSGGYISSSYSSASTSNTQYWIAPAKFRGNLVVRSLGQDLVFSMQQSHAGATNIGQGDVRIENGGNVLVYQLPVKPALAPQWSTYTIKLDESGGWKSGSTAGAVATRAQIIQVLTNVTAIEFRASYITNASYTAGLDDVMVEQTILTDAPTITTLTPPEALPGTPITITGDNFDPTAENNIVWFGSVAAHVTSASLTELIVDVPVGAMYGPVTVINKAQQLMATSPDPFTPLFNGGGRIIPSSFDRKIDINSSVSIGGLSVADIDGDGWADIIVADESNQNFKVHRNAGAGGDLTSASFEPDVSFATGGQSANGAGLKVIDLDGDGKLDVVSSIGRTAFVGSFVTFRNTSVPGTVSFDSPEQWDGLSDESPVLNVADIDGDGRPDLMGSEGSSSSVSRPYFWIAQNISTPGNVEFAASRNFDFNMFDAVSAASVGDLDGDGKPEIVVRTSFSGAFHVLQNNCTPGVLAFSHLFSVTSGIQGGVQIADLNEDGKNDLAWKSGGTNDVVIRLNGYAGGVLSAVDFATQVILQSDLGNYGGVSLADLNGDGRVDLAVADNGNIGIFENVYAGGTFDASAFVSAYLYQGAGNSTYPTSVISADLNGDLRPDMVAGITNTSPNRISIFENRNVHAPVISVNTVSPLAGPVGSTVTITGDYFSPVETDNHVYFGAIKAVVSSASKTELTVTVPAGAAYAPVSVRVGELSSRYHLPFNVTFSSGVTFDNTHFAPPVNFTLTTANFDIDVSDLDLDGKADIMAEGSGGSYAFRNTHVSGPISTASLVADDTLASFTNPRLEDIDGDGLTDVVAVNGRMRQNASAPGEIGYNAEVTIGTGGSNLAYGDFNADGKTDVAMTNGGSAQLLLKENLSMPGAFTAGQFPTLSANMTFAKPSAGGGITTGDFDGDGSIDVVVTNPATDNISFYRNLGHPKISTAQFDARIDVAVSDNPGRIYSGDLDSDGKVDLMMYHGAGANANTLTVFHNQSTPGNISFMSFTLTLPGPGTIAHIDDLDGDSKPEILAVSESSDVLSIFKNNSVPGTLNSSAFAAPFNSAVANPRCVYTADLNLDGKREIIVTAAPNSLLVYENLVGNPTIEITTQPPSNVTACEGNEVTLMVAASGGEPLSYRWQMLDGSVYSDIADGSGFSGTATATLTISAAQSAHSGEYRCQISSPVALPVISDTTNLNVRALPAPPSVAGETACTGSDFTLAASGAADGQYRWYDVPVAGSPLAGETASTLTIPALTGTTIYYVTIHDGLCESERTAVEATVLDLPSPPTVTGAFICGPGHVTLTASGASDGQYRWYEAMTGGSAIAGEVDGTFVTPELNMTTPYYVSIHDGVCESSRNEILAIVGTIPAAPSADAVSVCENEQATLIATGGSDGNYRWYTAENAQVPDETSGIFISPALTASTSYFVSIFAESCESEKTELVVTVLECQPNAAPVIASSNLVAPIGGSVTLDLFTIISDEDDNLDPTSFQITQQPESGADAAIGAEGTLRLDYSGTSFSGLDQLTVRACDMANSCTEAGIVINVVGDIEVFNAISPNGDGLNEILVIQYIDALPDARENVVTIFNRWGDVVFSIGNYDNTNRVFRGVSSSGGELPSGTYFYKIEFTSGRKGHSGYLSLKR